MSFEEFGLHPKLLKTLAQLNYTTPSPIQKQAFHPVADGADVCACAQTGTGKTAAFSLPLLNRLAQRNEKWRSLTVLILAPTRELATQIHQNIEKYAYYLPVRSEVFVGGTSFDRQARAIKKGVNVLVSTPGRLVDHLQRGTVSLDRVETLVLDEADNMLDMGFIHDVRKIVARIPKTRQNLLFSATYSKEIQKLVREIAHNPVSISVAPQKPATETVSQMVHRVDRARRRELLVKLMGDNASWDRILVFTRTKHGANRLARQLEDDGVQCSAIHGDKSQSAREQALARFKSGRLRVLVATDVASRGIDIAGLPCVVNFDLPDSPEVYVHRIGRTGRAGLDGYAASLVSAEDLGRLRGIERLLMKTIPQQEIDGFEPTEMETNVVVKPTHRGRGRGSRPFSGPRQARRRA